MPETRPNPGQRQRHHRWQDTHPAIDDQPFGMSERTIGPITYDATQRRSRPHPTSDRWQGTPNQIIIPANDRT